MSEIVSKGADVHELAASTSILDTNPVVVTQFATQGITAAGTILIVFGFMDEAQRQALIDNATIVIPALFSIAGIIGSIIGRAKAWSPKSAAQTAVANAQNPPGTQPVLVAA